MVNNKRKSEPKWSIKKADWNKFQNNCIQGISLPDSNDPTDDIYDQFIDELTMAIDGAIPKTSAPRQGKSPVPWWTDKCSEVTRDKKRALNRLKTCRHDQMTNQGHLDQISLYCVDGGHPCISNVNTAFQPKL